MTKIGLVLPGNFARLAGHHAFGHAWYEASLKGFPKPDYITGSSAGAIAAANIGHWDEDHFRKTEEMLLGLSKQDFVSLNPKVKKAGAITALASLGLLLPTYKIKNPWTHWTINAALAAVVLSMEGRFLKDFMASDSFFVLENLIGLLKKSFDFKLLFDSPVQVEVPTVDINKASWRSTTNFKREHQNRDAFVNGVVDSIRIWGFFNPRLNEDGGYNVDAAVLSNVPIQFAIRADCDVIVVAYYDSTAEGPTDARFTSWVKSLQRSFDIVVSENSRKTIRGYLNVNNDLEQLDKHRRATDELEHFLGYWPPNQYPRLQEAVRLAREAERSYSFIKKRRVNLVIVKSEPLPIAHFSDFDADRTLEAMNICYKAFNDAQDDILKAIKSR